MIFTIRLVIILFLVHFTWTMPVTGAGKRLIDKPKKETAWVCPLNNGCIIKTGRGYSDDHQGIDLEAHYGDPVYPAKAGVVWRAGVDTQNCWGPDNCPIRVMVNHLDGTYSGYWHLKDVNVKVGQSVWAGKTLIGHVGMTGITSFPHIHFIVMNCGEHVNPESYFYLRYVNSHICDQRERAA